jgi:FkbM family methyltransferase
MPSIVAKLVSRFELCRLKYSGRLAQVTWKDVGSMVIRPNRKWPTHKLANPQCDTDRVVRFDTPIGSICWDMGNRRSLGLLVFEELCETYEHGSVTIRPGDVVLDLGAHVGTFTRFALQRGASRVIAFEPEPSHVALLRETFAEEIEKCRVCIVEAAAWEGEGRARFQSAGVGSKLSDAGALSVSMTTVDTVVKQLSLARVDFIKADIEGAERHALSGAKETIKEFGPRMALCIYHLFDDPQVIPRIVTSIRPYLVKMNAAREQAFFQIPSESNR